MIDSTTKEVLPFVHIGVKGKNIGVISDDKGRFSIKLEKVSGGEQLYFSIIGYETKSILVGGLNSERIEVAMKAKSYNLNEITVKPNELLAAQKMGRYKTTKITTGQSGEGKFGFGGEWGIKITFEGQEYVIEDINFHTRFNTVDSALFRLNVYKMLGEMPGESILQNEIFVKSYRKDKWVSKNVLPENLIIRDDIIVTFEFIQIWYSNKGSNALFYTNGKGDSEGLSYSRDSSFDEWKINEKPPIAMYISVRPFK